MTMTTLIIDGVPVTKEDVESLPLPIVATGPGWRLALGDCLHPTTGLASLGDGSVDVVLTDPPYGERTHAKQQHGRRGEGYRDSWVTSVGLGYDCITPGDVAKIGPQLSRVSDKWALVMTSHDLVTAWEAALGRYTFAPLPIVLEGMMVRLGGDGPSSWTVWLMVNRATGLVDGTKPGAYVGSPGRGPERADNPVKGHKPEWLMEALIRDYTKPGDLVCDPFAGSGTTGVAAIRLGRRFIGFEKEPKYFEIARRRLAGTREQLGIDHEARAHMEAARARGKGKQGVLLMGGNEKPLPKPEGAELGQVRRRGSDDLP